MLGVLLFWVGCPLSRLAATASRLPRRVLSASGRRPAPTDAAAETGRWATSHRDVAAPKGEPSRQLTRGLQKAKSRLPPWGRWTRVSEDGEGKVPAAPSHGLCGSAGGLPSQSRLPPCQLPQGGEPSMCAAKSLCKAKPRLPLWGRWTRVSEDGEGKLPAPPSAPVAIALTGACAPGAGFFLAAAH